MSKINLYPCFSKWLEFDNIYLLSDPHFNDEEMKHLRKDYIGDDEQVERINKVVHKKDLLICLGDVGNLEYIKKIKAGYKVLIMGNHDKGKTNYQRKIEDVKVFCSHGITKEEHQLIDLYTANHLLGKEDKEIDLKAKEIFDKYSTVEQRDNHLFDEVYEGTLTISSDIVLSHEPLVDDKFHFNLHGHDHSGVEFVNNVLQRYDADMPVEDMVANYIETIKTNKLTHMNLCAEWVNYTPVSLREIIKSGILKNVVDIHRACIDRATARKAKKQG